MRKKVRNFSPFLPGARAFRPAGEEAERDRATKACPRETLPPLPQDASLDAIPHSSFLANGDLEARCRPWIAATAQILRDSSSMTTVKLTCAQMIDNPVTAWPQIPFGVANDSMTIIPWPRTVGTAARRALEIAPAAGARFEPARLELRARTLGACLEYAFLAVLPRVVRHVVNAEGRPVSPADQDAAPPG
ncbi:MAG TPA: hypothetical protein VNO22_06685 [Planctomycetota bacterium]|nr:hypothetical protein [Planctomycetota bacterium]